MARTVRPPAHVFTENVITGREPVNVIQDGITCIVICAVLRDTMAKIVSISVTAIMELNAITSQENASVLRVRLLSS